MLRAHNIWKSVVACGLIGITMTASAQPGKIESKDGRVIAIDVLLVPDATMVKRAEAVNAKLRSNYPEGYTLGPEQVAHITLIHSYVRENDLPAIEKAIAQVMDEEKPLAIDLMATGVEHGIWAGVAITSINIKPTAKLSRLQHLVAKAIEPYKATGGNVMSFSTTKELPKIDGEIVSYVEQFATKSSGEHYKPHVTVGVARADFVKKLEAEPFETFSFAPASVAIYQLGNFGTAQKQLWEWKSK
jgi:2'-5' RNA ligase